MLVYTVGLLRNTVGYYKEMVIASMYVCATGHWNFFPFFSRRVLT